MKRLLTALLGGLFLLIPLCAQGQDVVLTASAGSRLSVALPNPAVQRVDAGLMGREFTSVLQRNLEESGSFSLLKGKDLGRTDPASYKAWMEAGADWLLVVKADGTGDDVRVEGAVMDTRTGKQVFAKPYVGKLTALRRIAHTLSDDLVGMLTGTKGIAASRIVFYKSQGNGIKEIWQVDADGSNSIQLTNHKSLTMSPSVALDGKLAYVTYKGGTPEIWGQKTPGGPHVKLAPAGGQTGSVYCPSWAPDGRRLAFTQVTTRRGDTDIMLLDVESGKARRITQTSCGNTDPTWNPSGNQIAFTSDRDGSPQVFLMEDDGSNMRRLTREGSYNTSPAWSPSGRMIAYVSRFENDFQLFVYKLDEGKAYQIALGVSSSESPSWSPDERRLVFASGTRAGRLYTTDLSGNQVRPLGDMGGCQSPKWSRTR